MIYGHATTSHGLLINRNNFVSAGCVQPRDDRGGIAAICPNNNKPSGTVGALWRAKRVCLALWTRAPFHVSPCVALSPLPPCPLLPYPQIADNNFITCPNSVGIYNRTQGCTSDMTISNNTVNALAAVALPQISLAEPPRAQSNPTINISMLASCLTPNATLRYTLDGSRPMETSPIVPAAGIVLQWPGPNVAFNVRGFSPGMLPSPTQGMIVERQGYVPHGSSSMLASSLDGAAVHASNVTVHGWADDHAAAGGGVPPVKVQVQVNSQAVAEVTADAPRPSLVPAGVAPNPDHGFVVTLNSTWATKLSAGRHLVRAFVDGSPSCPGLCELDNSPICVVDGRSGVCH